MIKQLLKKYVPSLVARLNQTYNHIHHLKFFGSKRDDVFRSIYANNHWKDLESASGPGSSLKKTSRIRESIPAIIRKYEIKTMLDIPCGDFNWMKTVELGNVKYTGLDIVPEIISKNNEQFASPLRSFVVADLVKSQLEKVDLIFCRDCFVHLSYQDIMDALQNIKRSNSKFLLTTTFTEHDNFNIVTGNWRPVNLQKKPFILVSPIEIFSEGEEGDNRDKAMALWKIRDL
jgi:SAM-dependent methyltransferase